MRTEFTVTHWFLWVWHQGSASVRALTRAIMTCCNSVGYSRSAASHFLPPSSQMTCFFMTCFNVSWVQSNYRTDIYACWYIMTAFTHKLTKLLTLLPPPRRTHTCASVLLFVSLAFSLICWRGSSTDVEVKI